MVKHAKWYINVRGWRPTCEQWLHLTSSIDEVEVTRINRFNYKEDSKSSLVGHALIRKFVSEATRKRSNELRFTRTQFGRPVICENYANQSGSDWPKLLDFNVSHSGDYCVLAGVWSNETGSPTMTVGVDVTKIVNKTTKQELERFLDLMSRREFTKSEWRTVEEASNERQKCINFTRLWCLKESFIKSIGLGLSFKLNRISFHSGDTLTMDMLKNNVIHSTTVSLDGQLANDWLFQETALDDEHMVAIGYNLPAFDHHDLTLSPLLDRDPFVEVAVDSLIGALTPVNKANKENWIKFCGRSTKTA